MILPMIDIGDVFYHSANKSSINKLCVLQKRAIRTVYKKSPQENTDLAVTKLKLLAPGIRRLLHIFQIAK